MTKSIRCKQFYFGIPGLDESKTQFIDHVNITLDHIQNAPLLSEVQLQLTHLSMYTSLYFRLEEIFLHKKLNAYDYFDHKKRHLFFEQLLKDPVIQKTNNGYYDTEELATFVADWINFHIQHLDKNLYS